MKEDEYIDLDKINEMPRNGEGSGFPKNEEINEKKVKTAKSKENTPKKSTTTSKTMKNKKISKNKNNKTKENTKITKKTKKKNNNTNNNNSKMLVYFLLGIIFLAIIVLLIASLLKTNEETTEEKVLFLINGVPLMDEEVQTRADWLRLVNGVQITNDQATELSIDVELMYQEAQKRNITVSENEINNVFSEMAFNAELSQEELINYIENLGIKYDLLRDMIKKEMYARELTMQEVLSINITEEEARRYYEENTAEFVHDELAKIRHIQINFETNKTEEETLEKTEDIQEQIFENKTNFCELAQQHSDDLNSLFDCGEYVFEKQPEFNDAVMNISFELEENETTIVKSSQGYHIVWKIEKIDAGISSFEDVKEIIVARLEIIQTETKYFELIDELYANAEIENYTVQKEINNETNEQELINIEIINETQETIDEDENEEIILPEIDFEQVIKEAEKALNETVETTPEEQPQVEDEEEQVEDEEIQQIVVEYEEQQSTMNGDRILKLAKCLTEKNAKMYNVYWSPHGKQQAEAFGEYFEHIMSIECDAKGTNPKITECKNALNKEYPTWPTWKINDELYEGYQNLNKLATISGCPY